MCMYLFSILQGEGNSNPLQYPCLENPMDGGAWYAAVHGVSKSWTQLSDFTFTFHFHALEKEMATHSSVLAWRLPGMGEPGGLPSMGSHRVGHDWSDLAAAAAEGHIVARLKRLLYIVLTGFIPIIYLFAMKWWDWMLWSLFSECWALSQLFHSGNSDWFYFGGAPKPLQMVTAAMKLKDAYSLGEKLWPT